MSTKKEQESLKVTPLNENEAGQIEGGFAEIMPESTEVDGLNVKCPTNASGCGGTTAPAQ